MEDNQQKIIITQHRFNLMVDVIMAAQSKDEKRFDELMGELLTLGKEHEIIKTF